MATKTDTGKIDTAHCVHRVTQATDEFESVEIERPAEEIFVFSSADICEICG